MSYNYIPLLSFLILVGACNDAPDSGTSQAESATVAGDDGAVAAPDFGFDTDNSNAGTAGTGDAAMRSDAPPSGGSNSNAAGSPDGSPPPPPS